MDDNDAMIYDKRDTLKKLKAIDRMAEKELKDFAKYKQENVDNLTFALLVTFNLIIACLPSKKLPEYISNICGSSTVPFL
jgi:hypothetical protein